jgi:hypothetical protein
MHELCLLNWDNALYGLVMTGVRENCGHIMAASEQYAPHLCIH